MDEHEHEHEPMPPQDLAAFHATVQQDMRRWLERAVIGLNLCPFAKAVHVKGQIHYAVSSARDPQALLADLEFELKDLVAQDPQARDTTLLIAPHGLQRFADFNDFLAEADAALLRLTLAGLLQIANMPKRLVDKHALALLALLHGEPTDFQDDPSPD